MHIRSGSMLIIHRDKNKLSAGKRLTIDDTVDINAPQGVVVDAGTPTIGGGKIASKGNAVFYVNSPGTAKINATMDGAGDIVPMDAARDVELKVGLYRTGDEERCTQGALYDRHAHIANQTTGSRQRGMHLTLRNGVALHDEAAVRKTLNALVGKPYYDGYVGGAHTDRRFNERKL